MKTSSSKNGDSSTQLNSSPTPLPVRSSPPPDAGYPHSPPLTFHSPQNSPLNHHTDNSRAITVIENSMQHSPLPSPLPVSNHQIPPENGPPEFVMNRAMRQEPQPNATNFDRPAGGGRRGLEDGGVGRGRGREAAASPVRTKTEGMGKAALGFRLSEVVLCLISFSVMAADKTQGWSGDSFDRYKEYSPTTTASPCNCDIVPIHREEQEQYGDAGTQCIWITGWCNYKTIHVSVVLIRNAVTKIPAIRADATTTTIVTATKIYDAFNSVILVFGFFSPHIPLIRLESNSTAYYIWKLLIWVHVWLLFGYCLSMNVIAFAYAGFQACDLVYQLVTGKHIINHHLRYHFDFFMDQVLAYLLISASSSAATRVDDWQSNWGKDEFTEMASASIGMSLLAFVAFAISSLISGYNLSTVYP